MPFLPSTSFEIGALIDNKYRVESLIGQGGMGQVYKATHTKLGRTVAIKTLHPQFLTDDNLVQRFYREAEMAASIGHDNICEVTDIGTTEDGFSYLVMPLLRGSSLAVLLQKEASLTLSRLADIILQTLSALEAAHQSNIVHRDLKPDNIFVTQIGDRRDFVKLLDFGISKIMDQDSVCELTKTGAVLGTPHYMSPEQAKGIKDIDHRVDIYAAGVIMYEGLTGRCPFQGDSYNEIIYKILLGPFPTPRRINPSIPEPVEKLVLRAMSRDITERYQSASEMRAALERALTTSGQTSFAPLTRAATPVSDGSPFTPTGLSAAATPTGLTAESTPSEPTANATPTPSAVEIESLSIPSVWPRRTNTMIIVSLILLAMALTGTAGYFLLGQQREQSAQHLVTPASPVPRTQAAQPRPAIPKGVEAPTLSAQPTEPKPEIQPENSQRRKATTGKKMTTLGPSVAKKKRRRTVEREREVASKSKRPSTAGTPPGTGQQPEAAAEAAPENNTGKKVVKGRFGTKFIPNY